MESRQRYTTFGVVSREEATRESGIDFLCKLRDSVHPAPPFAAATKIWLVEAESGRAVFEGEPSANFYNPMGTVHGGWISSLLDSAMGCAVHSLVKPGQSYTTIEMKVNFVRPVFEKTGLLRCEAKIVHFGARIATSEATVIDQRGKLIAHGSETCMIFEGHAPKSEVNDTITETR
jgi:uncharacterized protein (TIGR00369 family)